MYTELEPQIIGCKNSVGLLFAYYGYNDIAVWTNSETQPELIDVFKVKFEDLLVGVDEDGDLVWNVELFALRCEDYVDRKNLRKDGEKNVA